MKGHQSIPYVETFHIRELVASHHNDSMPMVRANLHCFFFLKNGEATVAIGDKTYNITDGEILIIPEGQIFAVKSYNECAGYMGGFHNNFLIANSENENIIKRFGFLKIWSNPKATFPKTIKPYIENLFDRIYLEFTSDSINKEVIKSYIYCLLNEINKVQEKMPVVQTSRKDEICNTFKELIFSNARNNLSVSDYASKLNISVNHLNKIIKSVTGKSSSKWIEESIVTEAKIMLYQTKLSISEISENLNIYDHSYFSRLFKKTEGITPTQFRKRI